MHRRNWLFGCLLGLILLGSPQAQAVSCSQVFPKDATSYGVDLEAAIDAIFDDVAASEYSTFASSGTHYAIPDKRWFYRSGTLGTWGTITVEAGAKTWLFFDGDLDLQPNSTINPVSAALDSGGNPEDLIIIVRGNLEISTKNKINALIYATGNVNVQPNSSVLGAITAKGRVTIQNGKNTTLTYDPEAAASFDLPELCGEVPRIDHFRLVYAPQALTCQPHAVTVTACANADCSRTLDTSATLLATDSGGAEVASVAFATGSTGTLLTALPLRRPGAMTLGVAGASSQCSSAGCVVSVADAGFILEVPPLLAGKQATGSIQAVRKDDASQLCVPAFESGSRTLLFTSGYSNPASGTRQPRVNGQSVSVATPLEVTFGAQARAPLRVRYDDAGQMSLAARYAPSSGPESGLLMSGSTTYVSRPYGLHLSSDAACLAANVAGCTQLIAAGDSFPLRVRAVAWEFDGEARSAAQLADNPSTPNFELAGIALSSTVAAPAGGGDGSLSPADYAHRLGEQTALALAQSEVGIFRLVATPPAGGYFGYSVGGGESGLIGRFTPAYLRAEASARLQPACGGFSYQQQEIGFVGGGPLLTVTGHNRSGAVTDNYDRGEFWRLGEPLRDDYRSITGRATLDAAPRLQTLGAPRAVPLADLPGDGSRQFRWDGDRLLWTAAVQPLADDLPFGDSLGVVATARLHLAAAQLTDADGVCHGGGCTDFDLDFGGSEVRLGRLRFGNAFGAELQALDVPFWLETWQVLPTGLHGFGRESGDDCSVPRMGEPVLQVVGGALQPADFSPSLVAPLAGQGAVRLPAPGKVGSVSVGLAGLEPGAPAGSPPLLPWLLYDWSGEGVRAAARGMATFGIYRGSAPLIYRRELYR